MFNGKGTWARASKPKCASTFQDSARVTLFTSHWITAGHVANSERASEGSTTLYGRGHGYKEAWRVGAIFVIHFTWLLENRCIWALNCPPLCLLGITMHLILMRCWKRNDPASVPEHLSFLCVLWRDGWRVLRLKHAGCPRGSTHVDNWNEGGDRFLYDTNHALSDQKPQSRSLFSLSV